MAMASGDDEAEGAQAPASRPREGLWDPAVWVLVLATLWVGTVAAVFARRYHYNVVDDAYISFQYAKNWSLGRGVVFNPGEYVEGYTNFLWVAVLTPVHLITSALGADFTGVAIRLNVIVALLNLGLLLLVGRQLYGRDALAVSVPLVLCALDCAYLGYAMSGLENHLVILGCLGALYIWQRKPRRTWLWMGAALSAVTMTRPDGALFGVAFFLALGLGLGWPVLARGEATPPAGASSRAATADTGDTASERGASWRLRYLLGRRLLLVVAAGLVLYGSYFLWRFAYYGELLPNTFHLKVGDTLAGVERGLRYTRTFFADRYDLPLLALPCVLWIRRPVVRWLLIFLVLHVAYVVYVGGDFYTGHRFYVALVPAWYLLVGFTVHRAHQWARQTRPWAWLARRKAAAAVALALVVSGMSWLLHSFAMRGFDRGPYGQEILRWSSVVDNNVRYMKWLGTVAPSGASMVLGDVGAAGFFADLRVVDVYGVVDPVVARMPVKDFGRGKPGHEKRATRSHLLKSDPTYIKWGYVGGDLHGEGYYVFTDFPDGLDVEGLWVREDLGPGALLPDTAIHFDRAELRSWQKSGSAFRSIPATRSLPGQKRVFGQRGGFISSYTAKDGDLATGRLMSPAFPLVGDRLLLRVGGGRDAEKLHVSLLVDGQRIATATGHDHETLGRRVWDISPYQGRQARLEIVDQATGTWGHILVDEVIQWRREAAPRAPETP